VSCMAAVYFRCLRIAAADTQTLKDFGTSIETRRAIRFRLRVTL